MRKQKTKYAPIWHRFNGRLYEFKTVEDMKRFQIQLANKAIVETNPVCEEGIDASRVDADSTSKIINNQDPS